VLRNPEGPAAALVAIDLRTGGVKAMFGGRNFRESQINLAAQALRQPGSAFKPIVLATAMGQGISPLTELESKKVSIDAGDRVWTVTNYDHTYLGRVNFARALVSSDNTVYAQLTDLVGPKAIVKTAHDLGIRSPLDAYFSIGLGSVAVNPLEMARAYSTIGNNGRRVDGSLFGDTPRVVESVERIRSGRVDENAPEPTEVTEPGEAELLTSMLEDVVSSGTGVRAAVPGVEVAGKTGTTDNYGDAWFVGFTPEIAVAVWVGYPDQLRPMRTEFGGEPVTGGTLPAQIWKEFVTRYEESKDESAEDVSFASAPYLGALPMWVVRRGSTWVRDNQYCRGAKLIVFFSGRGPEDVADCKPNEVAVPVVIGMREDTAVARLAAQPLGAELVYKPAKAGKAPGIVLDQLPKTGGLSANDDVTLVVSKARFGLLPNFVGSSLEDVGRELKRLRLRGQVVTAEGDLGTVLRQSPAPGVSIAPRMRVRLVVGGG
jgi:membrane peptidoglycan carboxypeptidase